MSHTLILTKIYEAEVELTDEEYEDYKENKAEFLEPYWDNMDVVETQVEEF
jgi:predicted double-glycine peptidase